MTITPVFIQDLRARLAQKPHQHIVKHALSKTSSVPKYNGFGFGIFFEPIVTPFMEFETTTIKKINLTADITLYNEQGKHLNDDFKHLQIEFYLANEINNYDSAYWLLLDISDLLFYLNRDQNTRASEQFNFHKLTSCEYDNAVFNYISAGREFRNRYFNHYSGPVFDLYYEDELKELFAIATNGLAFLYRTRDRAIEELELTPNFHFTSQIHIYPRFNNAIAEVAGTIYAAWERVAFLLNEFFPVRSKAPSFKRYISEKENDAGKDTRLQNTDLTWFIQRINGDHLKLENLRHPTVHYNTNRTPTGTRAVELMKTTMEKSSITDTKKAWIMELEFLFNELKMFDYALGRAISLLNKWASL